ncbi:MAG: metal-dependent transcriptional regulator [Candidatus Bathyarchaeia archaeon]
MMKLSQEAEEYLEAIYKLQSKRGVVRTTELAKELKVVPGSVTNTLAHLERHGLVERKPYHGVRLTAKGEKIALTIIRKHRLAERLLTDILEVDWSDAHEKACLLEHAISEDLLPILEKRLGYPKICPHGNPIPSNNGKLEDVECESLTNMKENQRYTIVKIIDERKTNILSLTEKGVKIGACIQLIKKTSKKLVIFVNGKKQAISRLEAKSIMVKPVEGAD